MRPFFRLVCVLLLAAGAGFLTYGAATDAETFRAPLGFGNLFATPSEVIAWGVGMVVGGILLLLFFGVRAPTFDKPGHQAGKDMR